MVRLRDTGLLCTHITLGTSGAPCSPEGLSTTLRWVRVACAPALIILDEVEVFMDRELSRGTTVRADVVIAGIDCYTLSAIRVATLRLFGTTPMPSTIATTDTAVLHLRTRGASEG